MDSMEGLYDYDGNPIAYDEWVILFWHSGDRHIALDHVGDVEISTVWMGMSVGDDPPLIYESMVFGGELHDTQWRYPNRVAALAGHDQLLAEVREVEADARPPPSLWRTLGFIGSVIFAWALIAILAFIVYAMVTCGCVG